MAQTSALKFRPPEGSVPWHEAADRPVFTDPGKLGTYPVNYFVPNFGEDEDMKTTVSNAAIAEEE